MNNPLRITFLDFDDIQNPLLGAGQANATFSVARRLVRYGHAVTVICSRFPGSKDGVNQGVFYRHIGLGTRNIKLNNAIFFFALPFAVHKNSADVVVEAFTAPISTCFSPLFTTAPVIGMPTMFEADQFAKKYRLPFDWIESLGCKFYKYFLAYSPANKIKMEKLNPKVHTRIIPNGVNEEMFDYPQTAGDYGVFIGRIDIVQKGLDLLLSACRIAGNELSMKILIAGNGPSEEEEKLRALISENNLSDKVSFIGRVDGEKKMKLLAGAAFGIYCSRFEDFPLVPLELAALQKPLVCFDITGLAWVPNFVSLKASPFDAKSLAKCLVSMAADTQLRDSLASKCRLFARQYGWNEIARQYESFFYEVIKLDENLRTEAKI